MTRNKERHIYRLSGAAARTGYLRKKEEKYYIKVDSSGRIKKM